MINNFPSGLCSDEVGDTDDLVQSDLSNNWNHNRCLNIAAEQYKKLKKRSTTLVLSKLCNGKTFLSIT